MLLLVTSSIVNNISCVQKWHLARWPIWVETSTLPRAYIYLGTSRVSDVAIIFALIFVFHLCLSYTVSSPSDTSLGPHFNFYWRVYPAKQQTRTQVPSNAKYHQTPTTKTNKRNVNILHLCNKLLSLTHFNDLTTEQLHTPPPYSTITSNFPPQSCPRAPCRACPPPRAAPGLTRHDTCHETTSEETLACFRVIVVGYTWFIYVYLYLGCEHWSYWISIFLKALNKFRVYIQ